MCIRLVDKQHVSLPFIHYSQRYTTVPGLRCVFCMIKIRFVCMLYKMADFLCLSTALCFCLNALSFQKQTKNHTITPLLINALRKLECIWGEEETEGNHLFLKWVCTTCTIKGYQNFRQLFTFMGHWRSVFVVTPKSKTMAICCCNSLCSSGEPWDQLPFISKSISEVGHWCHLFQFTSKMWNGANIKPVKKYSVSHRK